MKQELLDLKGQIQEFSEDNFVVSDSNLLAFSYISNWPDWNGNILLIYGPKSCGKTHLVNIWAQYCDAEFVSFTDISNNNIDFSRNLVVENINKIKDEASLFHLYNNFKEKSKDTYLVFTANTDPSKLDLKLPDLKSRLNANNSIKIDEPDSNLITQFIFKSFINRQIKVDNEVVNFISQRIERSFDSINKFVDILDKESLKHKRKVTIPFVKQYL